MKDEEEILTLAAEINEELGSLKHLKEEIEEAGRKIRSATSPDKSYFIESTALKLHNFYTGCERIFEKIAGDVNRSIPTTHDWHIRLLKKMTIDIPGVRPPVISRELGKELEEYLKFRHLVRSIYGFELHFKKMSPLIQKISQVTERLCREINNFIEFLRQLSSA